MKREVNTLIPCQMAHGPKDGLTLPLALTQRTIQKTPPPWGDFP